MIVQPRTDEMVMIALHTIANVKRSVNGIEDILTSKKIQFRDSSTYSGTDYIVSYKHLYGTKLLFKQSSSRKGSSPMHFAKDLNHSQKNKIKEMIVNLADELKEQYNVHLAQKKIQEDKMEEDFQSFLTNEI